jgi:hypothetical protein
LPKKITSKVDIDDMVAKLERGKMSFKENAFNYGMTSSQIQGVSTDMGQSFQGF